MDVNFDAIAAVARKMTWLCINVVSATSVWEIINPNGPDFQMNQVNICLREKRAGEGGLS